MNLRVHRGEFGDDRLSSLESVVEDLPWDSLEAAQAAFDAAPFERLGADEIELVLRWRSSGGTSRLAPMRNSRAPIHRLRAEALERRDVPTPAFAFNLLAVALPPAIVDWNDRRASQLVADDAYISAEPGRSGRGGGGGQGRRSARALDACQSVRLAHAVKAATVSWAAFMPQVAATNAYESQPNDRALVELLAASAPSSRSLEPLSWCA